MDRIHGMTIPIVFHRISARLMVLLCCGMFAGNAFCAQAGTGSPIWLSELPEPARSGLPIFAQIDHGRGICLITSPNPQDLRHDARLIGGDIVLDVVGEHAICPGLLVFPERHRLPELDPGEYRLVVNRVDDTTLFPASALDREFLGEMSFSVGSGPVAIPVNHPLALIIMLLGMLMAAGWFLRRSRRAIDTN